MLCQSVASDSAKMEPDKVGLQPLMTSDLPDLCLIVSDYN